MATFLTLYRYIKFMMFPSVNRRIYISVSSKDYCVNVSSVKVTCTPSSNLKRFLFSMIFCVHRGNPIGPASHPTSRVYCGIPYNSDAICA